MPTTDIAGIAVDYATQGDPDDPTILLVAGLGSQRITWPPELVDGLVERGHHVVTFDNRDVGCSTILHDKPFQGSLVAAAYSGERIYPPYTLGDMAADAVGLLDHLGVERAHVVGVSMGGMIAQHLAFDHPKRVSSLTSIMSTTGARSVGQATDEALGVLFAAPPTGRDAFVDDFVGRRRIIGSPTLFDEERTRELAGAVFDRGVHPAGTGRQLLAILADRNRTERLRRITAPTLVIHGPDDPLIHVSGGEATAAAIRDAKLLLLDGMGHDLPVPLVPAIVAAIADHVAAAEAAEEAAA